MRLHIGLKNYSFLNDGFEVLSDRNNLLNSVSINRLIMNR
jgi:hypothetical protein